MYTYALQATLGDDVYFEPTVHSLEVHIAKLTGKEAALFVPSGTMSNQVALRTHLVQPPHSVLCDYRAHINRCVPVSLSSDHMLIPNRYETGGAAFHSGAHTVAVIPSNRHYLTLSDVKQFILQGSDVHMCETMGHDPDPRANCWFQFANTCHHFGKHSQRDYFPTGRNNQDIRVRTERRGKDASRRRETVARRGRNWYTHEGTLRSIR